MSRKVEPAFSEVVHAPVRLRISGILRHVAELEFSVLRNTLEVSDASLSKHLKVLADAGLVAVRKEASSSRSDARRLTWIALTPQGSAVLDAHLAALAEIAGGAELVADAPR